MSPHVHFEQRPWEFPVSLTLALLLAAALYLHGWISARSASAGAIPAWKASNFFLGLALVWTAWGSPSNPKPGRERSCWPSRLEWRPQKLSERKSIRAGTGLLREAEPA